MWENPENRAYQLLKRVLTPEERAAWGRTGKLVITGSHGTRYSIRTTDYVGNIEVLDRPPFLKRLLKVFPVRLRPGTLMCAHPRMYDEYDRCLPSFDAYVAQVLALKADEKKFINKAHIYLGR
jgi:hypothetical protein